MNIEITEEIKSNLIGNGIKVKPSKTKQGKFRWFQSTGGDGVSVPALDCSDTVFDSEHDAWMDAYLAFNP
jgi:hypothetical protein